MNYFGGKMTNEIFIEVRNAHGYCFECTLCDYISRSFTGFYIEAGEINKEEKEQCFIFNTYIKGKKPIRFVHESEIFI